MATLTRGPLIGAGAWLRRRVSVDAGVAIVAGLTLLALGLRLLIIRGLWVDEAITAQQAQMPFGQMIVDIRYGDVHPPLHHVTVWATVQLLGASEWTVRLPSIVFGTLLVPMLYLLGRDLYTRRTGVVAAAFGAFAPVVVWYSQEARMYALVMLLSATAVVAQYGAIRRVRWWTWVLYTAATIGLLWTHYVAGLQVAVQQLAFLVVAVRRRRRGQPTARLLGAWLGSLAVIVASLLPLLPIVEDQVRSFITGRGDVEAAPGTAGAGLTDVAGAEGGPSVYGIVVNLIWTFLGYHSDQVVKLLGALWPLGMLFALFLLGRGPWRPPTLLLLAAALGPMLGLLVASYFVSAPTAGGESLFEVRYFSSAVPPLLALGARVVTSISDHRRVITVVTTVVVATMLTGLADQQLNSANPRLFDFRGALQDLRAEAAPEDVVIYAPDYLEHLVAFYAPDLDAEPMNVDNLPELNGDRSVHVLASFLDVPATAARVGTALVKLDREGRLVDHEEQERVEMWEFR
ncbi:MAG: glycosyltransferase family 39 protein [Actinomycetota bacterium]|nr:glycosyltransferase family 39 protein [Actinomycetota bacterium]